jgi:6-phosphogluconolactonase
MGRDPHRLAPHLVVLGLGEDGHTASLFPECPLPDPSRDFVALEVPGRGWRLTATYGLLSRARHTVFLVTGVRKAGALARVLAGDSDLPAARVAREAPDARWLVDRAAAGLL